MESEQQHEHEHVDQVEKVLPPARGRATELHELGDQHRKDPHGVEEMMHVHWAAKRQEELATRKGITHHASAHTPNGMR